ncbi:exported hypothetical protein [metagenome]|uniref:Uncharacterized protein n=1 Tax=metagenome TaxID=256318 RepID=A0A2P2BXC8_9ZZZZ
MSLIAVVGVALLLGIAALAVLGIVLALTRPRRHAEPVVMPELARRLLSGVISAHDLSGDAPQVRAQLEQVLKSAGVRAIEVDAGTLFDPSKHFVLGTEVGGIAGTVMGEVRTGWVLAEETLRPAEVIVWTG